MIRTEILNGEDALQFISRCRASGARPHFFQSEIWMHVLDGYRGFVPFCIAVTEARGAVAYMPFLRLQRYGFSEAYSMPFGTYGGLVSLGDSSCESRRQAFREIEAREFSRVNIVSLSDSSEHLGDQFVTHECKTHVLDLTGKKLEDIADRLSENHKRNMWAARENDLEISELNDSAGIEKYLEMTGETADRHGGSPTYDRELYERVLERIDTKNRRWRIAYKDGEPCAGHLYFVYRDEMFYWDGCSSDLGREVSANFLLFYEAIEHSLKHGLKTLNFGASPAGAESLVRFKRGWGAESKRYFEHDSCSQSYRAAQKTRDWLRL